MHCTHRTRIYLKDAMGELLQAAWEQCEEVCEACYTYGLAKIRVDGCWHPDVPMSDIEKSQYELWVHKGFLARPVDLRRLRIERLWLLKEPWQNRRKCDTLFTKLQWGQVPTEPHFHTGTPPPPHFHTDVMLTLPHTICTCVIFGAWDRLLLPLVLHGGSRHKKNHNILGLKHLSKALGVARNRVFETAVAERDENFHIGESGEFADFLAQMTVREDSELNQELCEWILKFRNLDSKLRSTSARQRILSSRSLINTIKLATQLKNTEKVYTLFIIYIYVMCMLQYIYIC